MLITFRSRREQEHADTSAQHPEAVEGGGGHAVRKMQSVRAEGVTTEVFMYDKNRIVNCDGAPHNFTLDALVPMPSPVLAEKAIKSAVHSNRVTKPKTTTLQGKQAAKQPSALFAVDPTSRPDTHR